jgi:ribosomal protein S18 acetylase RimI-like enzyme
MRQITSGKDSATWIAEENGLLAGFAVIDWAEEPGAIIAYIQTIEVDPEHRKKGIGSELLRRVEDSARTARAILIWLHVDALNDSAIRLYRAHGYRTEGRQEHYYARGRAAEIYVKPLQSPAETLP